MEFSVEPAQVFNSSVSDRGEGSLLALKLALQAFQDQKIFLVFSPGSLSPNARYLPYPSMITDNPLASARGLAASTDTKIVVFAGDVNTEKHLEEFKAVKSNITYICYNNAGSTSMNFNRGLEKQFSHDVHVKYKATASVGFPNDFMEKLIKSRSSGFAFIEVHCPSPSLWKFDPSNTIEVARAAVDSYIWPLLEWQKNLPLLTHRPLQQETAEMYTRMQSRFSPEDIEMAKKVSMENTKIIN